MQHRFTATLAVLGLIGGISAAAPASAEVQFAVFNPVASNTGGVVNFSEDSSGHLTSVSSATPTVFTFDLSPLSAFGDLNATFNFSATESGPASTGSIGGQTYVAAPFDGSFNYYYNGPTVTQGAVTLTHGELLLGGTFTNAAFTARDSASGGGLADDSLGGTVTYTSGLPSSVLPLGTQGESFSFGFINITPVVAVQGGVLRAFTAVGDGKFSSALSGGGGGGGVPEPATWALMLTGVMGVGFCLRRRQRLAAAV